MDRNLAVITARGGSKRIPKKNIRDFCGKPIIAYSIEAAKKASIFDTVMVSTDSAEIGKIAEEYGAKVPFYRSKKTSDDYATTRDVLMEVLDNYRKRGEFYDVICCLYPTAPFVTPELLQYGMNLMQQGDCYHSYPIVKYSFPPQRAIQVRDGFIKTWQTGYESVRSQDLEPIYHECGMFYYYNVKEYLRTGGHITTNVKPIIMSELLVQDIDTEEDWKLAEIKYKLWKKGEL